MMELNIQLEVALKSGARILLNQQQTESVTKFVQQLITGEKPHELLPPVSEFKKTRRGSRVGRRSFSDDEDTQILSLLVQYPIKKGPMAKHGPRNPVRHAAIKQLAKKLNRSEYSITSRMWKLNEDLNTRANTPAATEHKPSAWYTKKL